MSYKSILLHIDDDPGCPARAELAIRLATRFEAHLTALAVGLPMHLPQAARAIIGPDMELQYASVARERMDHLLAEFKQQVSRSGFSSLETRSTVGDPLATLVLHARYHDLVIVGQHDPDGARTQMHDGKRFQELAALTSGRPLLFVPHAGRFTKVEDHIVVAWDAGKEAARAMTDALPLLKLAKRVTLLVVNAERVGRHGGEPGADAALFLTRHGVRVTVMREHCVDLDVGTFLLSRLADLDADMLVMGAYGHSRLRELALGGVTRTMLESMTVPVLMSH